MPPIRYRSWIRKERQLVLQGPEPEQGLEPEQQLLELEQGLEPEPEPELQQPELASRMALLGLQGQHRYRCSNG
jgi:hypothetical protein